MGDEIGADRRLTLLTSAVDQWSSDLIETTKRNPLLYYRDLKAGTLSIAEGAAPEALAKLLSGGRVGVSQLFPSLGDRDAAVARVKSIRKRAQELFEERGVHSGYLVQGLATWWEPDAIDGSRPPAAPVILREISILPKSAAQQDFELQISEPQLNPVLAHHLAETQGVTLDELEVVGEFEGAEDFNLSRIYTRLRNKCSEVRGFDVEDRIVVGNFTYQKLPMVQDLKTGAEVLLDSDVVMALAGDPVAQEKLRTGSATTSLEPSRPDATAPADEFLIVDADSSQNYAINAVLAGQHVVIKGPPGTGKSQTIANLMASLIARGNRVLFVAEKRAAIDAVLRRVGSVGLDSWVMDLHETATDRRKLATQLAAALDSAARATPPNLSGLHDDLVRNRARLIGHNELMHGPRMPWGVSVFDLQSKRIGSMTRDLEFRLSGEPLLRMTPSILADLKDVLAQFNELGGLSSLESDPWTDSLVESADTARSAVEAVLRLRTGAINEVLAQGGEAIRVSGITDPQSAVGWAEAVAIFELCAAMAEVLQVEALAADLQPFVAATASRKWRKENDQVLGWGERRTLAKSARAFSIDPKVSKGVLHQRLAAAADLRQRWASMCTSDQQPTAVPNLVALRDAVQRLTTDLDILAPVLDPALAVRSVQLHEQLSPLIERLYDHRDTVASLPRRNELQRTLAAVGLVHFISECRRRDIREDAPAVLEGLWTESVLEQIALTDPDYGSMKGATLSRTVDEFKAADTRHIDTTSARIQRLCAENLYKVRDAHPDQDRFLRAEAARKRGHKGARHLIENAPDVLLALKPCWAMSPLVVSHTLPMAKFFDVVIFDEASQIPPADAIASIARGRSVVVAGDDKQLPPTKFFGGTNEDADDEDVGDSDLLTLTSGFESILTALTPVMPTRTLGWHYRSQDERLIAFSNAYIYESALTTFPGAHLDGVLSHHEVPWGSGSDSTKSSTAEVTAVADAVIRHAETRPDETLGVIAFGIHHADRIDAAVRERLRARDDLQAFFDESREERFFVKNLERVQGDERDAIILSVGYGKNALGNMLYNFGPINQDGGERRLNVAVSRAKKRMSLVSSFGSADLDRSKLTRRGPELLAAFVSFMESRGADLGNFAAVPPPLNPFEQDIRDRLTAAGLKLVPQYGVGNYRIDFVAAHPEQPGRYVLAIEADGASYHSSATARDRDRLRQEHLERLGWRFHRIWSTDWFRNPDAEVQRVLTAYASALNGSSAPNSVADTQPRPTADPEIAEPAYPAGSARTALRPRVGGRPEIGDYATGELVSLVLWIESDQRLRTEEEVIREAMAELGFKKLGSRIESALREATRRARTQRRAT